MEAAVAKTVSKFKLNNPILHSFYGSVPVSPPWTVVGIVLGVVVVMAIVIVGIVAWWVHKKRKLRNDTKQ